MIKNPHITRGFTAVELLITLFVAAVFLASGYQLYSLILTDSGSIQSEASASNVAYDYLRKNSNAATNPCTESTPVANQALVIEGATNSTISISVTCPQVDAPTLSQLVATITYTVGSETLTTKHATYVDKSQTSAATTDVTNGLIGWWQLNENADSSVGGFSGQSNRAYATTGQNGREANAYGFNGSTSYIAVPMNVNFPRPTSAFTISAWVKPTSISSTGQAIVTTSEGGGWSFYVGSASCPANIRIDIYIGSAYVNTCSTDTATVAGSWVLATAVYTGSQVRLYINAKTPKTTSTSGTMAWATSLDVPLCIGAETSASGCTSAFLNGSIDDVRLYDRALSASEVTQLYNQGGK